MAKTVLRRPLRRPLRRLTDPSPGLECRVETIARCPFAEAVVAFVRRCIVQAALALAEMTATRPLTVAITVTIAADPRVRTRRAGDLLTHF